MASGRFESNTGVKLNLRCDWTASADRGNNCSYVTAKIYLLCYSIGVSAKSDNTIAIGDHSTSFSTPRLDYNDTSHVIYLTEYSATIPHDSNGTGGVEISADWYFGGNYKEVYIDTIEIKQYISFDSIDRSAPRIENLSISDITETSATVNAKCIHSYGVSRSWYKHDRMSSRVECGFPQTFYRLQPNTQYTVTVYAAANDTGVEGAASTTFRTRFIYPNGVKLFPSDGITLQPGRTFQMQAAVIPINASDQSIQWYSSNESVVRVSQSGLITAVGKGTATITVRTVYGEQSAQVNVTVTIPVTAVTLPYKLISMGNDEKMRLSCTVSPDTANNKAVIWNSDRPEVVSVSETGEIQALVDTGVAVITVTTKDGGFQASLTVDVIGELRYISKKPFHDGDYFNYTDLEDIYYNHRYLKKLMEESFPSCQSQLDGFRYLDFSNQYAIHPTAILAMFQDTQWNQELLEKAGYPTSCSHIDWDKAPKNAANVNQLLNFIDLELTSIKRALSKRYQPYPSSITSGNKERQMIRSL